MTGSSIQLSYADGDIWDWAVDWDTWVSMSALPPPGGQTGGDANPGHRPGHAVGCPHPVRHTHDY
ncbi:conserved hypothetical protein [Mycobacterium tuberculosis 02_1987]|nr:conserved hypothetical protein [Mycobacterium tuberculosis 02_1987]